jgi:hypothetical protein
MNRQNKAWLASVIVVVGVVGIAAYVNLNNQERLAAEAQTQARQDLASRQDLAHQQNLAGREEMGRQLSESAIRNELDFASRRESALQAQITAMTEDVQQQAKRQQAERELQDLRAQRAQLQKQVNCERIQLSMNQLTAKGDTGQALSLQKQWNLPCPNLGAGG